MYTAQYYIVEIAAALIGLSYPFMYQIISSLDSKYKSVHIVRLFRSNWINRAYNTSLIFLMICVVIMPLMYEKDQKDLNLILWSYETFSLIILIVTLVFMFILFRRINFFYDYIKLHGLIDKGIKNDVGVLKSKLDHSRQKIGYFQKCINDAPASEFWISDYEINDWYNKIARHRKRVEKIMTEDIPNNKNYRALVDLLRFSIKVGDTDLYIRASNTFHYCVEEARVQKNYEE